MSDAQNILPNHDKEASDFDAWLQLRAKYSTNSQGLHFWVFEYLHLPPIYYVLEVGCRSGSFG
jgi:hypothetical protein